MKIIRLILLLLILPIFISAQISEQHSQVLRKALSERVNELRKTQGLKPLEANLILRKAAKHQSNYMASRNTLTHSQSELKWSTPLKRVRFHKGMVFEMVGENVLQSIEVSLPLRTRVLEALAEEMFLAWKNSPGHYANMIHPAYELAGIDFQLSKSERVIYATQVFGKKGAQVPGQLSTNAFGLQETSKHCRELMRLSGNVVANMGNALYIEGNQVMFYYHNLNFFNKIFSNPNDGIAVDLIARDQLDCSRSNQLDYSPIHDGILLQPVYREELLANNVAQSDYRIITKVGTIPETLRGKELSPALVLIKEGKKCEYLLPGETPSKAYQLRPIDPLLYTPEHLELKREGIIASQNLTYNFHTDQTIPVRMPSLKPAPNKIHSIEINSFSSVEGPSARNTKLHTARAQTIKNHLQKRTKAKEDIFSFDTRENWEKMYFQLEYYFANDLANYTQDSLKRLLASGDKRLPWDSLLFVQRESFATINYWGKLPEEASLKSVLQLNLKTALLQADYEWANKTLAEMYLSKLDWSEVIFEKSVFKILKKQAELTQNVAAVLANSYRHNLDATTIFLFYWLKQKDQLTTTSIHNLLHLHTLLSQELLNAWDLPAKRLSNAIPPAKFDELLPKINNKELMLNLHLTFIKYFGQINDGQNILKSFNFISGYFKSRLLKLQDEIDLVLFFNYWSMYHLTNEYLLGKFQAALLNEEAIFILLKTLSFYSDSGAEEALDEIVLKALELNKARWCNWVNKEFQVLRNQEIKNLYCAHCDQQEKVILEGPP